MHFAAISSRCKTQINFLFYLFFAVKKKRLNKCVRSHYGVSNMFYSTRKKIIFFGIHFKIGWFGLFIEVTWWCNSLLIITRNSVLVQGCSSETGRGTFLFSSSTGTNELPSGGLILCRIMFELRGLLHRVVIENAPFHCSRTSRLLLWLMKRISSQ